MRKKKVSEIKLKIILFLLFFKLVSCANELKIICLDPVVGEFVTHRVSRMPEIHGSFIKFTVLDGDEQRTITTNLPCWVEQK